MFIILLSKFLLHVVNQAYAADCIYLAVLSKTTLKENCLPFKSCNLHFRI